jgi:cephalosporin-C deacetylase-like acetyl esterase
MRTIFLLFLLTVASCEPAFSQDTSINELRRMFDYDQKLPLDVKEVGFRDSSGVRIHDINYASPKFGRVTAYLVEPSVKGKYAGIVFGHWGYGNRTEFLPEAILYARAGVVSLLIDYPWVRPAPWRRNEPGEKPEAVLDNYAATVIDLRRGIDLLQARSDVDSNRIAYVGHSTGAQWGAILSAIDKRVKAAVLMGGIPTEATIALESDDPEFVDFRKNTPKEQIDKYFKTIGVMDAINYVPYAAPTPLLFQFARYEQYFNEAAMLKYARAASEPKLVRWYDAGHGLNDLQALIDRADWLQKRIGIKPVTPILQEKLNLSDESLIIVPRPSSHSPTHFALACPYRFAYPAVEQILPMNTSVDS